jgi:Cu(I)/Ag(I) efflux system membrane fusion protein
MIFGKYLPFCFFLVLAFVSEGVLAPSCLLASSADPVVLKLTPEPVKAQWVKTEVAVPRKISRTIRRTGTINFDEGQVSVISARVAAREVKILAFEGQRVSENDDLAKVYSPDYVTAEVEYLNAFRVAKTSQDASEARSYIQAVAKKLLLMGASRNDLNRLSKTGKIDPYLTIHSPRAGTILNSQLREGLFMNPGDQLLTIANLSRLWVYMDIFEGDLPLVRQGQKIMVHTVAYPENSFEGKIIYLGGMVDPATRTFHVRGEIANPDNLLKPGMFASVVISLDRPTGEIALPDASFIRDDQGYHVFVETTPGSFIPREVSAGDESDGQMTIFSGVTSGEKVVVSGAILLENMRQDLLNRGVLPMPRKRQVR